MRIIGERINGAHQRVAQAIEERNAAFIQDLAIRQADAGADWLDVNAGTRRSREPGDLIWLVETIQSVVETQTFVSLFSRFIHGKLYMI